MTNISRAGGDTEGDGKQITLASRDREGGGAMGLVRFLERSTSPRLPRRGGGDGHCTSAARFCAASRSCFAFASALHGDSTPRTAASKESRAGAQREQVDGQAAGVGGLAAVVS